MENKQYPVLKWKVSLLRLEDKDGDYYKVTRSIYELGVAETKIFQSKEKAKQQFEAWLE